MFIIGPREVGTSQGIVRCNIFSLASCILVFGKLYVVRRI